MKKLTAVLLTIALIFIIPIQAPAAMVKEVPTLVSIADETIYKSADLTYGNSTITYSGIDVFVDEAHSELPSISDAEITQFLIEYTGQSKLNISEEEANTYLNSKEIVINNRFVKIDENGTKTEIDKDEITAELDREKFSIALSKYQSNNEYLEFTTIIARQSDVVDGYVDYRVGAYATWLKMPKWHLTDLLFIDFSDNVVFDSNQEIYGKLEETITCHEVESHYKSQAWKSDDKPDYFTNKNVYVDNGYFGGAIGFKLKPAISIKCGCDSLIHRKKLTSIRAFVSFGISVEAGKNFEIQPAYCHTKLIGIKSDDLFYNEFPANVDVYISMPSGFTAYNG